MQVLAWKCEDTGKLFESEDEFKQHRASVRSKKAAKTRELKKNDAIKKVIDSIKQSTSIDALEKAVTENFQTLVDVHCRKSLMARGRLVKVSKVEFSLDKVSYDPSLPEWYTHPASPGLRCVLHVSFVTENRGSIPSFFSDLLKLIDIHTRGGGGGASPQSPDEFQYGFYVNLYENEWPNLVYDYASEYVIDQLSN